MECSDGIDNAYWMAYVENKLVGCSGTYPLFACSCHASFLIINFKLFLSLGVMIIFDGMVASIVTFIMN